MVYKKAVIVLANEMDAKGLLNLESANRADLAATVFRDGNFDALVTCGWDYREDSKIPIAEAFRDYLVSNHELERSRIHAEVRSRDTVGDAVFTRLFFDANVPEQIALVTSEYHLARSVEIFHFVYGGQSEITGFGSSSTDPNSRLSSEAASQTAFSETFRGISAGNVEQITKCMLERHPYYNGNLFPRINFAELQESRRK